ncbi:MAG TPA: T9SS type A sorting domain-containing protein, partial [Clostridiales bacterium]|nr:T9SS type A sorting domain-containing protein [Clostridiales bacterium]
PQSSKLYQNYPNPFNPVTKIEYDLAEDGYVSLTVYDVTGRKVAELENRKIQAGSHSIDFDGSRLTSGVYYYTLRVGKDAQTKKMIMIK